MDDLLGALCIFRVEGLDGFRLTHRAASLPLFGVVVKVNVTVSVGDACTHGVHGDVLHLHDFGAERVVNNTPIELTIQLEVKCGAADQIPVNKAVEMQPRFFTSVIALPFSLEPITSNGISYPVADSVVDGRGDVKLMQVVCVVITAAVLNPLLALLLLKLGVFKRAAAQDAKVYFHCRWYVYCTSSLL